MSPEPDPTAPFEAKLLRRASRGSFGPVKPIGKLAWWRHGPLRARAESMAEVLGIPGQGRELWNAHLQRHADRAAFWAGSPDAPKLEVEGLDALVATRDAGSGAVVLGNHWGGYDALLSLARAHGLGWNPVLYDGREAEALAPFEELCEETSIDTISAHASPLSASMEMLAAIQQGECISLRTDLFGSREGARNRELPFLGGSFAFPARPLRIAAMLPAPIFEVRSARKPDGGYRVRIEPFPEALEVALTNEESTLRGLLARSAERLEASIREDPLGYWNPTLPTPA